MIENQIMMIIYSIKLGHCVEKVRICNCYNSFRNPEELTIIINYLKKEIEMKDLKKKNFFLTHKWNKSGFFCCIYIYI